MGFFKNIKGLIGLYSTNDEVNTITLGSNTELSYSHLNRNKASEFLLSYLKKGSCDMAEYTATYAILLGISQLWKEEAFVAIWDNPQELEHVVIRTINYFWTSQPDDSCLTKAYLQTNGDLEKVRAAINWKKICETWNSCKPFLSIENTSS